jgi:hypothetical protein
VYCLYGTSFGDSQPSQLLLSLLITARLCQVMLLTACAACRQASHLEALLAREAVDLRWQELLVFTWVPRVACWPGRSWACAAMPRGRHLPAVHCAADGAAATLLLCLLQLLHLPRLLLVLILLLPP